MNLRKAFPCRSREQGVTLLELILVMALLAVLSGVTVPVSLRFYYTHLQTETLNMVLSVVRSAQLKAQYNFHNSPIGVKLFSTEIVVFEGDSYMLRNALYDEVYSIDPVLVLGGDSEVVFIEKSGIPVSPATLSFAHHTSTTSVVVTSEGLVDKLK